MIMCISKKKLIVDPHGKGVKATRKKIHFWFKLIRRLFTYFRSILWFTCSQIPVLNLGSNDCFIWILWWLSDLLLPKAITQGQQIPQNIRECSVEKFQHQLPSDEPSWVVSSNNNRQSYACVMRSLGSLWLNYDDFHLTHTWECLSGIFFQRVTQHRHCIQRLSLLKINNWK